MEGCCPGRVDHTSKGSGNDGSCVNYICHKTDHHPLDSRNQVKSYNGQLSRCEQTLDQQDSQFIRQLMKYPEFQNNKQSMVEQFVSKSKKFMFSLCRRINQDNQRIKGLAKNNLETLISWKPFNLFERRQNSRYKSGDYKDGSRTCDYDSRLIACWAVYSACWSVGDYLEEDNMADFMGLTVQDWKKSVQSLKKKIHKKRNEQRIKANKTDRNKLASKNLFPSPTALSTIIIMTKKLDVNIDASVKRVMTCLCKKIQEDRLVDQYHDVIAVGVFFEVCERTQGLQGQFRLKNLCDHVKKITYSAGLGLAIESPGENYHNLKILLRRKITPILDQQLKEIHWEGKIEPNGRQEIVMGREED